MKRWVLTRTGSAFEPAVTEVETPAAGAGEVAVRVRACSLNYRDLLIARGESGLKGVEGRTPLSDGAGEVLEVGAGVSRVRPGDRVAGIFFRDWVEGPFDLRYHDTALGGTLPGMLSEVAVLPEHALVPVPNHLTFEQAACLPCAGVTAWRALVTCGRLQRGQTVLCLGTGGVSILGLQLAVAHGARVLITSSSDAKLERARALGASGTINYRSHEQWEREVWRLTEKRGVDHVLEVGGPATLDRSVKSTGAEGHIALIGVLTGFGPPSGSLFPLVSRNGRLSGIYVGSGADFRALNAFLETHRIAPVVDRVFGPDEVAEAYRYLASGAHVGKVVIRVQ